MEDIASLFNTFVSFALDLVSLALVVVAVVIVAVAIYGMARNRTAAWDNLLFIPIVLFLGALLLQYYPPLVMKSVRIGVQSSRSESQLLRDEMQQWVPGKSLGNPLPVGPTSESVVINLPATEQPAQVPTVNSFEATATVFFATALPSPTSTPLPTSTPEPVVTICTYTLNGVVLECPPTPIPGS